MLLCHTRARLKYPYSWKESAYSTSCLCFLFSLHSIAVHNYWRSHEILPILACLLHYLCVCPGLKSFFFLLGHFPDKSKDERTVDGREKNGRMKEKSELLPAIPLAVVWKVRSAQLSHSPRRKVSPKLNGGEWNASDSIAATVTSG